MISVIVPVYNVEQYLSDCIRSILCQTYKDFELILVDDGSPDRSGEICDRYAEQDARIRVIHQPNGGVSRARNVGLDHARGEWVCFIDADDLVLKHYLEAFDMSRHSDSDLIVQGMLGLSRGRYGKLRKFDDKQELSEDDYLNFAFLNFCGPMCKLFRMDKIRRAKIRFPEGLPYGEDSIFFYSYLNSCSRISTVKEQMYVYRRDNPHSASHKIHDPSLLMDYLEQSLHYLHKLYEGKNRVSPYPSPGGINIVKSIIYNCILLGYSYVQYRKLVKRIRESDVLRLKRYRVTSGKERIFLWFVLRMPICLQYMILRCVIKR